MHSMTAGTDVIVVGAGAAGLLAGKELAQLSLTFVMIKVSHRIGGRAYAEEIVSGVSMDLGCTYLEGAQHTFIPNASDLGVPLGEEGEAG